MSGFVAIPDAPSYWLRNGKVSASLLAAPTGKPADREGLVDVDLEISGGKVAAIAPGGTFVAAGAVDLKGGQIWPGFVDIHTHMDKGHIWPRAENPDGTFFGAFTATATDRPNWHPADVKRRFDFGLRTAYAHGTVAIRTHLDSWDPQAKISWSVFREIRDEWAGRIDLQASSIVPMDAFGLPFGVELADTVAKSGGVLGAVTRLNGGLHDSVPPEFQPLLDRIFDLAEERNLDLDFHVDESGEQGAAALGHIARTAIRRKFKNKIHCGHCCSLAVQPEELVKETLKACADSGLAVVSLPMCNMYLQDRVPGRTPRWRGVTLLHELKASGVPVSVASDNCRDPFYGFGDHDAMEVFTQATRIAHFDRPYGDWPRAVTATPAGVMKLGDRGTIKVGGPADLVLFHGRTMSELLSRRQSDRVVLRAGKAIDTTLPEYSELDELFVAAEAAA